MKHIAISISRQKLTLIENLKVLKSYSVSTAKNGTGCLDGSGCTPLGEHKIKLKIGHDCPLNTVFVGRRATGEIYSGKLAEVYPERDWILTRIIWLTGMEPGLNKGPGVDSLRRLIYIHGTPDTEPMGGPKSRGCIRMHNNDIVELFDILENNTQVLIEP